jgi:hypothetical protein
MEEEVGLGCFCDYPPQYSGTMTHSSIHESESRAQGPGESLHSWEIVQAQRAKQRTTYSLKTNMWRRSKMVARVGNQKP